jgi:hypothetical protein
MVGIPAKNVGTTTEEFKPYGITPSSDKWKIHKITLLKELATLL